MEITKTLGVPLEDDLSVGADMPYTISLAVTYRSRINSFYELPEDKRPPRGIWDKPSKLREHFDDVFDVHKGRGNRTETYMEFDGEDVE